MFQPHQEPPGSGTTGQALRRSGPGDAGGGRGAPGAPGRQSGVVAQCWRGGPVPLGLSGGGDIQKNGLKDAWGDGREEKRKVI